MILINPLFFQPFIGSVKVRIFIPTVYWFSLHGTTTLHGHRLPGF